MVFRLKLILILIPAKERKVDHPQRLISSRVDEIEIPAQPSTQLVESLEKAFRRSRKNEGQVSFVQSKPLTPKGVVFLINILQYAALQAIGSSTNPANPFETKL